MLQDILEESWAYQEMVAQGLAKGLQQGLQQGMQQGLQQGLQQGETQGEAKGEVKGLREAVIVLVLDQFPNLADFAQQKVNAIQDTEKLRRLVVAVGTARDAQEVIEALSLSSTDQDQE